MEISNKELPGLSQLTRDYLSRFNNVKKFFAADFRNWYEYKLLAGKVHTVSRPHSDDLIALLIEQNKKFDCGAQTLQNIEQLRNKNTLVVATGQQVGLFAGPLYTVYKALTTIKLARELEQRLHLPVLPLFYLVSEDHDFAEVQWAGVVDKSNHFADIRYEPPEKYDRMPVSQIILDESINEKIDSFAEMLPETEFKKDVIAGLKTCYQPGTAFHTAFARWFQKLFSGYGIILFDSADERYKKYARHIFAKELAENVTSKCLQKTNSELIRQGYHAQIPVHKDRPGLFILQNGRHSLQREGEKFRNMHSGELFDVNALLQQTENLSPKAVLRPIVEDTLFPTIAYVGGPGEIAYWAQLKDVYKAFDLPMPANRFSAGRIHFDRSKSEKAFGKICTDSG
ncbi:MAG: bacillithiol biosynthesis cysteine-adding enzyme BshC [Calditrichaeota bacterium]|nr:bacillithiol biosynthesis cysteine-adding enzyme BshC [Calditrichota bacterium]